MSQPPVAPVRRLSRRGLFHLVVGRRMGQEFLPSRTPFCRQSPRAWYILPVLVRFRIHYFVLFAVLATINPYFQLFLRARGFSTDDIGFLQGVLGAAGVAGPLVIGYLADRLGRRRTLLMACLAAFAARKE